MSSKIRVLRVAASNAILPSELADSLWDFKNIGL